MPTIEELLNSLQSPKKEEEKKKPTLKNTRQTWKRIHEGDLFTELGLEPDELDAFLEEWKENNPYENI